MRGSMKSTFTVVNKAMLKMLALSCESQKMSK
ncbi:hypothetical protein LINPERHAP2_LOCUS41831 [Linum perenne]